MTTDDERLMCSLGIDPDTPFDVATAGETVDRVLAAVAAGALSLRTDVRLHGTAASSSERRALFELLAAGLVQRRRARVWLTRQGRAFVRAEGVQSHD